MTKEELAAHVGKEIQVGIGKMILKEDPNETDVNWRYYVGDDDNALFIRPTSKEQADAHENEERKLREEDPAGFLEREAFRHRLMTGGQDGGKLN